MASGDPYRAGNNGSHAQPFIPPPQAYTAPPPVNNQQLARYYHDGAAVNDHNNSTSLAPWTAPPMAPHRGDSYRSQRSQRSQRSHRSRRSVHEEQESRRHREKRPTIGDSLFAFWGVMWGAVRSPSGKR